MDESTLSKHTTAKAMTHNSSSKLLFGFIFISRFFYLPLQSY